MHSVTLEEAQSHLSELITHLQPGETVEIISGQTIVARIVAPSSPAASSPAASQEISGDPCGICEAARPPRQPGSAIGTLTILSDDEAHLEHFQDYMP
jgi:antitoxin (DNA-binding transcriptional repressor) of toxin-antitoxin stability system